MPVADRPRVVVIPARPGHAAVGLARYDRAHSQPAGPPTSMVHSMILPGQLRDDQAGGAARIPALARRLRDDGRAAIKLAVGATALRCSPKP